MRESINKNTDFDAVILGNGDFPTTELPLSILRNAKYICCCDVAGERLVEHGMMPDAVVGDGDSMSAQFKEEHRDIVRIVNEQEDNDQTKATRHCIAKGFKRIAYLGATGKREDHTLGNISLIARYALDLGVDATMITDYGWFVAAEGMTQFQTVPRMQVSIFNLTCTELSGKGFRWNVYNYQSWWQGTLNEATGDSVTLKGDGRYIVYFTYI